MSALKLDLAFLLLVLATLATWLLGESGAAGALVFATVLGIAGAKSLLVIELFMGLRRVKFSRKAPVLGWLFIVSGLIALAYWKGMH